MISIINMEYKKYLEICYRYPYFIDCKIKQDYKNVNNLGRVIIYDIGEVELWTNYNGGRNKSKIGLKNTLPNIFYTIQG